jgi:hypothetical protein
MIYVLESVAGQLVYTSRGHAGQILAFDDEAHARKAITDGGHHGCEVVKYSEWEPASDRGGD